MTTPSDVTASDQRAETWTPLPPPFSKYEVSFDGSGPDQRPVRRIGGKPLATQVSKNSGGYLLVKLYDDGGKQQTKTVHGLILLGATGVPCPPGMESRHLDDDPLNNRWRPGVTDDEVRAAGGNLARGTKLQNAQDKFRNGRPRAAPPPPPRACVRCGVLFTAKGRRCTPCVTEIGQQASARLRAGMNLDVVTRKAGYQSRSQEWVHELARRHGGYAGTLDSAQAQGRGRSQRVIATLRYKLRLGSGDES
jgi:hypothetical protein